MGLCGGTSRAATLNIWRDTQVFMCLSAQITSGTPLVWHFIEYQRQDVFSCFGSPTKKSSLHAWSCFTVHSFFFFFFQGKIALGTSSFFSFTFSCFFLSIPPSTFLFWVVLTPLKHSTSLSAVFVYIRFPANKCARALFGSQAITLFRSELLGHLGYTEDLVARVFSPRASN